jgi:ligand-binding SRPBCC domain-containing protein
MTIIIETSVAQDYKTVFAGFTETLFLKLAPPLTGVKLLRFDGCYVGDRVEMQLTLLFFIRQYWKGIITDFQQNEQEIYFIDQSENENLPFFLKKWSHKHRIIKAENGSKIIDEIEYKAPFGLNFLLYPILYAQFLYRKPIYKRTFTK